MKCDYCGKEEPIPFRCPYCGKYFCVEHRLPEAHQCPNLKLALPPSRKPQPILYPYYRVEEERKGVKIAFRGKEIISFAIGAILVWSVGASLLGFNLRSYTFYLNSVIFLLAFILHELAHKIAASRNGLYGEFNLSLWGATLTLLSIFLPLKVIAPGAVVIFGYTNVEKMGKIAMWGPLTNIIIALIMLPLMLTTYGRLLAVAFYLNAFIATFNLLPFGILDGKKIIEWNKVIWSILFIQSIIYLILGYLKI